MKLFKKKQKYEESEFQQVDENKQDKIQIVVSRLENDTKVTIKQFWATFWEAPDTQVAYWINEKQKFKQPVADYYLTTIKSDIKKDRVSLETKLAELKKTYEKEIDKEKPDPKINIRDIEHEMEVIEHQLFLLRFASNGYSVINRNLQNYRKIEFIQIGAKLYPLGFNPKLMTYFIIPIDKDITLDKHRENVTLKHTTNFQKLMTSLVIVMSVLTLGFIVIGGFTWYKFYTAYDESNIASIERSSADALIIQSEQYSQATQEFREFVEEFREANKDLAELERTPQTTGEK